MPTQKTIRMRRKLSDHEQSENATKLAEWVIAKEGLEAEKKARAKESNDAIADAEAVIGRVSRVIHDGYETTDRHCDRYYDAERGLYKYVDVYTREIVMTEAAYGQTDLEETMPDDVADYTPEGWDPRTAPPKQLGPAIDADYEIADDDDDEAAA